jgi:hypothetical protein
MSVEQIEIDTIANDIEKLKKELKEKQDKLAVISNTEINKIVEEFVKVVIEKKLDKVLVKRAIEDRLTTKRVKKSV